MQCKAKQGYVILSEATLGYGKLRRLFKATQNYGMLSKATEGYAKLHKATLGCVRLSNATEGFARLCETIKDHT